MSSEVITIEKSGKFAEGGELQAAVEQIMGPRVQRAGLIMQAAVMAVTPVRTGTARRGWTTGAPEWKGSVFMSRIGNPVIYVRRVNRTSKENAGFIEKGVEASKEQAFDEIRAGAKALPAHLWRSK